MEPCARKKEGSLEKREAGERGEHSLCWGAERSPAGTEPPVEAAPGEQRLRRADGSPALDLLPGE